MSWRRAEAGRSPTKGSSDYPGQVDTRLPGEPVVARQGQPQRLGGDPPGDDRRVAHPARSDFKVGVSAIERDGVQFVSDLGQVERHPRMLGPEAADQVRDQPGAE